MLGVEKHSTVVIAEELDRFSHHRDPLVEIGAECLFDVIIPRLTHEADVLGLGLEQSPELFVRANISPGPSRRPKCAEGGVGERQLPLGSVEELSVLLIGTRPPTLDESHSEVVEQPGYAKFVADGEADPLLLGSITQCRVVYLEFHLCLRGANKKTPCEHRGL